MINEIVYSDIMEVYNRLFIDSICFIAVDSIFFFFFFLKHFIYSGKNWYIRDRSSLNRQSWEIQVYTYNGIVFILVANNLKTSNSKYQSLLSWNMTVKIMKFQVQYIC